MGEDFSKGLVLTAGFLSSYSLGFLPSLHASFVVPLISSWILVMYTNFFYQSFLGGECRCIIIYSQLKFFNWDFWSVPCKYCNFDMSFIGFFIILLFPVIIWIFVLTNRLSCLLFLLRIFPIFLTHHC